MLKITITLLFLSLLTGCASMDKDECLVADWYTIGYEDGSLGNAQSNISEYRKDCAEYQVKPDLQAYRDGHYEGSKQYCSERNGFNLGRNGQHYKRSCPQDLEGAFLLGYNDGQKLYSLGNNVKTYQSQLNQALNDIPKLDDLIEQKSELMLADGLVKDERVAIRDEIQDLQEQLFLIEQAIPELEQKLYYAQLEYDSALDTYNSKAN